MARPPGIIAVEVRQNKGDGAHEDDLSSYRRLVGTSLQQGQHF
jgi:hypothetical protein